jgi:hypothetical protein
MIEQIIIIAVGVVLGMTAYKLLEGFILKLPSKISTLYKTQIKKRIRVYKRRKAWKIKEESRKRLITQLDNK